MTVKPNISSLSNPLVKQVRALRQVKARARSGLFLVEGLHHVGSVLEAGWRVETLLYAPDLLTGEFAHSLLARAHRIGSNTQPVSAKVMEALAEKGNPQGILAVVHQKTTAQDEVGEISTGVALVAPQDPGNVGTILRTVEAAGVEALFILDGGVDLFHPTLVRASMGALFWKPIVQTSFEAFVAWARKRKALLIGTSAHAQQDYRAVLPVEDPWLLVMGNEQKGLSPAQIAACDLRLSVPMQGHVSSLNLAVATGIFLYALIK
jgi:TrmH family RNA methyltransferase